MTKSEWQQLCACVCNAPSPHPLRFFDFYTLVGRLLSLGMLGVFLLNSRSCVLHMYIGEERAQEYDNGHPDTFLLG